MEILGAFLVCGLISVLAQLLVELWPDVHGPTLFLLVQVIGALLVPLGAIAALQAYGQAGMVITVFNAGATVCAEVGNILSGASAQPLLTVLGVFLVVAVFGIVAGALRTLVKKRSDRGA